MLIIALEDSASEADSEENGTESEDQTRTTDSQSSGHYSSTPRAEGYPSAAAVRQAKTAGWAGEKELSLSVHTASTGGDDHRIALQNLGAGGLPASPRPEVSSQAQRM